MANASARDYFVEKLVAPLAQVRKDACCEFLKCSHKNSLSNPLLLTVCAGADDRWHLL